VPTTRELAETPAWGTAAIADRTVRLTETFLQVWKRPAVVSIDDDGLTPILDAVRRRGWPRGWEREFEYVEYRGEHWEVYDVKYLFNRIFKRLWADAHESVVGLQRAPRRPDLRGAVLERPLGCARRVELPLHGLGFEVHAHRGAGRARGGRHRLRGLFVKYSYIGAVMVTLRHHAPGA